MKLMQSTLDESVKELEKHAETLDVFEMTVLLKCDGVIREARVNVSKDVINLFLKKDDGSRVEESMTTLAEALKKAGTFCGKGHLLIDTLTVRTKPLGSADEYLKSDDEFYLIAKAAWATSVKERVLSAKTTGESQDLAHRFGKELLGLDKFQTNIWVNLHGALKEVELTSNLSSSDHGINFIHLYLRNSPHVYDGIHHRVPDTRCAQASLFHMLEEGELLVDTLVVKTNWRTKSSIADDMIDTRASLYQLTRGFWCAATGMAQPAPQLENLDPLKIRNSIFSKTLLSYLSAGKRGVRLWNEAPERDKSLCSFEDIDLENCELIGIKLGNLNFKASNFSSAKLKKLSAKDTDFTAAKFNGADLSESRLVSISACDADFSKAMLRKAKLHKADLRKANFTNADVAGADFKESNLSGVDLTTCNVLEAAGFSKAKYDDDTKLPADFSKLNELEWRGEGADPYLLLMMANQKAANPIALDFPSFLRLLHSQFDETKVSKSLSMLKKESFQLFSEETEAGTLGIIKSQTDPDLVYACKLGSEGTFACCTQNLNPCGGLQKAICKHIYVLVIGLAKTGEIDAGEVLQRLLASKKQTPQLNKDVMTGLFLRYKGAQNGDLDWRPTETIPEDYYSF